MGWDRRLPDNNTIGWCKRDVVTLDTKTDRGTIIVHTHTYNDRGRIYTAYGGLWMDRGYG